MYTFDVLNQEVKKVFASNASIGMQFKFNVTKYILKSKSVERVDTVEKK